MLNISLLRLSFTCIRGSRSSTNSACRMAAVSGGLLDLVAREGRITSTSMLIFIHLSLPRVRTLGSMLIKRKVLTCANPQPLGHVTESDLANPHVRRFRYCATSSSSEYNYTCIGGVNAVIDDAVDPSLPTLRSSLTQGKLWRD